ncbi:2-phosphoglycolate phosphatase [Irpex rosettiformis]|uniref:2-phosphoglycolate phosphatase n=1 Tax=Irpex rosettiformis TaxID=378272 RepID=A0ACB8U1V3_9APHY|nr:2-phosphoglycolate phosphatase [Irpex rosettiformis]
MAKRLSTKQDYQSLIDDYDTWLFDCDGVLWEGNRLIPGATDILAFLRSQNKSVIFVTNNATQSRRMYKGKFDKLGVEAHVDEIFGSAYAAAVYISSVVKLPKDKKVYVVGMAGIEEELGVENIQCIGGTDPVDNTLEPFDFGSWKPDPSVGAVLCGLDLSVNYTKLSKAFQYLLKNPECHFLATNGDSTYPSAYGLLPGAGAVMSPVKTALGREPLYIGKPNPTMLECIKAKHHFDPKRTIMVGDRLNTDIEFGRNGGLSTLLVLSGITKESDITGPNASSTVPEYVTGSVGDFRAVIP